MSGPGSLRLALALAVFVSHVSHLNVGRPAVMIFFVLSGYWVTTLFVGRGDTSIPDYLVARVLRVWPLMAVTAVLVVALQIAAGHPYTGSLASTLALAGLATRRDDVVGVVWSLDIEMQFYFLLPLALAVAVAVGRWFPVLVILTYAAGLSLNLLGDRTVLLYVPAFYAGAWLAVTGYSPRRRDAALSAILYVGLMVFATTVPSLRALVIKDGDLWWHDTVFIAAAVVLLPFTAWNLRQPSPAFDRMLGNLAFPFYLCHMPIVKLLSHVTPWTLLDKAVALLVSATVTAALYAWGDRPIDAWRRRLGSIRLARA